MRYFERGLSKPWKTNFTSIFKSSLKYENFLWKQNLELFTSPFSGCQTCSEVFPSLVFCHLAISDALFQGGYWVFPKIAIGDLSKLFLDSIPFQHWARGSKTTKFAYLKMKREL